MTALVRIAAFITAALSPLWLPVWYLWHLCSDRQCQCGYHPRNLFTNDHS